MKIVLTGARGQVGQELVEKLTLHEELQAYSHAELDITQLQQLEAIMKTQRPDLVINAAAYTAVDKAEQEKEKALAVNRDGVKNLALICKKGDIPLIHLSTDYVFDGSKTSPYVEEDKRGPLNIYGLSKAEGEILLQETWEKHIILRTSWVFGRKGSNFVKTILKLALKEKELKIVADQTGCPTAASDIAASVLIIARKIALGQAYWGVFHYCGNKPTNWFDFAHSILKAGKDFFPIKADKIQPIKTSDFFTPAKRPLYSVMSVDKIKTHYGITPSAWEQAIGEVIQDLSKQGEQREYFSA